MKHDLTPSVTSPVTLGEVIDRLNGNTGLEPQARRELVSAVNTVAKFAHCPPMGVRVNIAELRRLLEEVQPARFKLSARRVGNVRSLFVKALIMTGVEVEPLRLEVALSSAWAARMAELSDPQDRNALARFSQWCTLGGIEPVEVTDQVVGDYRNALLNRSFNLNPEKLVQNLVRSWNRSSGTIEGWPDPVQAGPSRRKIFKLNASTFPESFQRDLDAWCDQLAGTDPLAEDTNRPLRPVSVKVHRDYVLRCASALVHQGIAAASIIDLSVLTEIENARKILHWFLARKEDRKPSKQTHDASKVLMALASHWVRPAAAQLQQLGGICSKVRIKSVGMTKKNRDTLRLFENDALVRDLLNLPERLMRRALNGPTVTKIDAYLASQALAIAILINAPIRIENLANIRIDQNIIRHGGGERGSVSLWFPPHAVKNDLVIELPLAPHTIRLLDRYRKDFWPVLAQPDCRDLFPGRSGQKRDKVGLGMAIARTTERELGVRISPHQFRHIAGFLYLKVRPTDYETVRVLLGHKSLQTTIQFYAGMEIAAAAKQYDEVALAPHRGRRRTSK